MKPIYLDFNATTPVDPDVRDAMLPWLGEEWGNPSSSHVYGRRARSAIEKAREQVAGLIGAQPDEIVFTGCGTESDNLALAGYALAHRDHGDHLVVSAVEHPAVLETARHLTTLGFRLTVLPVDEFGRVELDELNAAIVPGTLLVSVMHSNNETGVLQPIREIVRIAGEVPVHTDAAQSAGRVPLRLEGVAMMSLAGHKFHAPKGIGVLYLRRGIRLQPIGFGGGQEGGLRSGTENVASIVGLGKAAELASGNLDLYANTMRKARDRLQERLSALNGAIRINGDPEKGLPNTLSVSFRGVSASALLTALPELAASPGAACHAGCDVVSHVLRAMRVPDEWAGGTVRFSTGRTTTTDEIDLAAAAIIRTYRELAG